MKHRNILFIAATFILSALVLTACGGSKTYKAAKKALAQYEISINEAKNTDQLKVARNYFDDLEKSTFPEEKIKKDCTPEQIAELNMLDDKCYRLYKRRYKELKMAEEMAEENKLKADTPTLPASVSDKDEEDLTEEERILLRAARQAESAYEDALDMMDDE